jgi:hypothetical protein
VPALAAAQEPVITSGGAGWQNKGAKALSFGLPAAGGASAGLVWFLDPSHAIDLDIIGTGAFRVGDFGVDEEDGGDEIELQFDFVVGYRMYGWRSGNTTTFIEPSVSLGSSTEDFGDNLRFGVGGSFGIEHMFADRFSLLGAVGLGLEFTDGFDSWELATFQTGLFANFYFD